MTDELRDLFDRDAGIGQHRHEGEPWISCPVEVALISQAALPAVPAPRVLGSLRAATRAELRCPSSLEPGDATLGLWMIARDSRAHLIKPLSSIKVLAPSTRKICSTD